MNQEDKFNLVFDIGEALLESGAELKRIELTIQHIAEAMKLESFSSYVMITGLFMTAQIDNKNVQARVDDISISPIKLGRIDAINSMSRQITAGQITPLEARKQLTIIMNKRYTTDYFKIFSYAFGSASFGYVFGGSLLDCVGAFFIGFIISLYIMYIVPKLKLSKIFIEISSSMIVSIIACLIYSLIPGFKLSSLIVGGIISLVPGVAIVNGIRYLFDEDYTAGWTQVISAVVTASCISVGVGIVLKIFNLFT